MPVLLVWSRVLICSFCSLSLSSQKNEGQSKAAASLKPTDSKSTAAPSGGKPSVATVAAALASSHTNFQPLNTSTAAATTTDATAAVDTSRESEALLSQITSVTHSVTSPVSSTAAVAGSGITTTTTAVKDPDAGAEYQTVTVMHHTTTTTPTTATATTSTAPPPPPATGSPPALNLSTSITTTTNRDKCGFGPVITLIRGDMRVVPWADTELIFVNSTCFDAALMREFSALAEKHCKPGTRIITFTKEVTSKLFRVIAAQVSVCARSSLLCWRLAETNSSLFLFCVR